jgi:hypothetical protein
MKVIDQRRRVTCALTLHTDHHCVSNTQNRLEKFRKVYTYAGLSIFRQRKSNEESNFLRLSIELGKSVVLFSFIHSINELCRMSLCIQHSRSVLSPVCALRAACFIQIQQDYLWPNKGGVRIFDGLLLKTKF